VLRVNITYSVNVEEILPEVERRIEQCIEEIKSVEEALRSIDLSTNLESSLDKMGIVRNKMLSIDYSLSDNVKIINGYIEITESISREEREAGEKYE
jgi:hypothetical protein